MVIETPKKRRASATPQASRTRLHTKLQHQVIQPSTLPLDKRDSYQDFLRNLVAPHVESFNFAAGEGLHLLSEELEPALVSGPPRPDGTSSLILLRIHSLKLLKPKFSMSSSTSSTTGLSRPLLPMQCRLARASYVGDLHAAFTVVIDNKHTIEIPSQRIARIPVMVGSTACHLHGKTRDELVRLGEEEYEVGGTFIINGGEKVIRLVVLPRPNHPVSTQRPKNATRGPLFTDMSLSFRSMRRDLSAITVHFHLLRSGGVRARINVQKAEYFIPVGILMRAFLPSGTTDRDIFELIMGGDSGNTTLSNTAIAIVKEMSERYSHFEQSNTEPGVRPSASRTAATAYLGKNFRSVVGMNHPNISDLEAGTSFLRRYIFVHLSSGPYSDREDALDRSKADLAVLLVRKLVATSTGDVEVDNADALSHLSVIGPGHLYLNVLKEKLEMMLSVVGSYIQRERNKPEAKRRSEGRPLKILITESISKVVQGDPVTNHMNFLLSTGNLRPGTRIDLPQLAGYSVMAERINFLRFIAHFRAVHRGAFYASMRSTKVRKLLPEAWGFICPVHTPDGAPCGILNHLAAETTITHGTTAEKSGIVDLFSDFNMTPAPALSSMQVASPKGYMPVVVDGRVLGFVHPSSAEDLAKQIRYTKVREAIDVLPGDTEVALIMPIKEKSGFMPGIYVYTGAGRVVRPVRWLQVPTRKMGKECPDTGMDEWIGALEQVFLRVRPATANSPSTLSPVVTLDATHEEKSAVSFLSVLAQLSPFPDMNQGPRNMFQCQMAKQTMGTPCHAVWNRNDSKVYRHTYPQVPMTRNFRMQDPMGADLFPNGVNAVVAVISYSGNDMEDALIINKASLERGFAHGTVYLNERVNLDSTIAGRDTNFAPAPKDGGAEFSSVDRDGLPMVGSRITRGSHLYGVRNSLSNDEKSTRWTDHKLVEDGTVDSVVVYDTDMYKGIRTGQGVGIRQALVRKRVSRRPVVGDKFASRAGQKGTMSSAWPCEDMPFTETGMTPDILFNPNGFPSRMTIGMMVELMSGKAGALHGLFNDSTPFQFDEDVRAVDYFADMLVKAGYQYSGNETLYSGYTGETLKVEIFTGIVHYQRLRHMVSDKFQVRSTGTVHPLFRQPIKGRKRGGAIRFGEMERDGLLAHGAAFLLRDRLAVASDLHILHVCELCGSLLSAVRDKSSNMRCVSCENEGKAGRVRKVALPYSFKYLTNELAAMNIRTVLRLKEVV